MATYSWKAAVSGRWTARANWSGNTPGSSDTAIIDQPGTTQVEIGDSEHPAIDTLRLNRGTLTVDGTLTLGNSATIGAAGTIDGHGLLNGMGSLVNRGVLHADDGTFLGIEPFRFTNQGTVLATEQHAAFIASDNFTNLAGTTLTGGSYVSAGTDVPGTFTLVEIRNLGVATGPGLVVNNATISLGGFNGALMVSDSRSPIGYSVLQDVLQTVGTAGSLSVIDNANFVQTGTVGARIGLGVAGLLRLGGGTLDVAGLSLLSTGTLQGFGHVMTTVGSAGLVAAQGGMLTLHAGLSGNGQVQIDRNATLVFDGTYGGGITNNGIIQARSGNLLKLSGTISGKGSFLIDGADSVPGATTLELATPSSADIAFNGANSVLRLDSPASFTGRIAGFGAGATIDLVGVTANWASVQNGTLVLRNLLTVVDRITLADSMSGAHFLTGSDGHGGTNITVTNADVRDYELEGPFWGSKTISWSFATTTFAADGNKPFSAAVDPNAQSSYAAVIRQALARWAALTGITFVQTADSAAVDIRIGWADLVAEGNGSIGDTWYHNVGSHFVPDTLVRLEDPAETALQANGSVIGGYTYSGYSATFYQVVLHELGHALGLGHSSNPTSVMHSSSDGAINQDANAGDIAGIQALYGAPGVGAPPQASEVACFVAGTCIATARGDVKVEALRPGDEVPSVGGRMLRVRWVGHRRIVLAGHHHAADVQLIRILAGAFGPGRPHRDLRLSPDHAVFVAPSDGGAEGMLVPARHLLNGATITQLSLNIVTYYHVEVEHDGEVVHDLVLAEGLPCETYLDTGNRGAFQNGSGPANPDSGTALDIWRTKACARLVRDGAELASVRAQLIGWAEELGYATTLDPDLRLRLGQRLIQPVAVEGGVYRFALPADAAELRIVSRAAVPAEMWPEGSDRRRLGVMIAGLAVRRPGSAQRIDPLALEGDGMYPAESGDGRRWRWTDGDARLVLPPPQADADAFVLDVHVAATQDSWLAPPCPADATAPGGRRHAA